MGQIMICDKCKRSIAEKEITEGLATEKDGHWTCWQCGGGAKRVKDVFQQDVLTLLDEIKNEIRSVMRIVSYKEASIWTIFGSVAQVFVFAFIAVSILSSDRVTSFKFLIITLICQVMAQTFFLLGK